MAYQTPCVCVLLVLYAYTFISTVSYGKPLRFRGMSAQDEDKAVNYLTKHGYLKMPNARAGELRSADEIRESIKMFQLYAGIPMTGVVDKKTMEMVEMPRCGMPDFGMSDRTRRRRRRRYAVQGTRWEKKVLTYMIEGGPRNTISEIEVEEQVDKAFIEWERRSKLKFTKSTDPSADILIRFRSGMHSDGYPFDGPGGTLAHGFYPHNNEGLSGDVHFDDDETWILRKGDRGTDFYWTALHEIGHALGLDHSNYRDAVMYPFYTGFKENLELNEDDVKGIHYIYGMPEITVETVRPTVVAPTNYPSGMPHSSCSFDAVFTDGNRLTYFLSGRYFSIVLESGERIGPYVIKEKWKELPEEGIDAAYYSEGNTTFFKGKNCWIYEGTKYLAGPIPMAEKFKNLDPSLESIDAAFVWGANGKTYLFKGDYYWRYNEALNMVDMGYPAKINHTWTGVPNNLNSAMTWINGKTYFFKDNGFWLFDNLHIKTTDVEPMMTNAYWMACSSGANHVSKNIFILLISIFAFISNHVM